MKSNSNVLMKRKTLPHGGGGGTSKIIFHIHSVNRYQLRTDYLYPSTLLWQINSCNLYHQPCIIHWCYIFRCWKFSDVKLNIGVFCAPCIVVGSALSFADGAAEVLQVQAQILYYLTHMSGHTWHGVHRGLCNKVSHTHTHTKLN